MQEQAALSLEDIFDGGVEAKRFGRLFALFVTPDVLPALDWETAVELLVASMSFDAKTRFQDGPRRIPCDIPSVKAWLGRRECPVVVDPASRLESHFGDEVARMWQIARAMPAELLVSMHGEGGLSAMVRTLLQWRAIDHKAEDWAAIVADVVSALNILRAPPAGTDFGRPLANILLERDGPRATNVEHYLTIRADDRDQRIRALSDAAPPAPATLRRGTRLRKLRRRV